MGKIITNPKTYTGRELETIFFRPLFSGPDARDLGIRILYNMPVPTTFNFWGRTGDILRKYACGWTGGPPADKYQKEIDLRKVKAEMGYCPEVYFGMIYELITNRSDVNLGDLRGTDLERAETELFRQNIAESIRATMWVGDVDRTGELNYNTFDGFLKRIQADTGTGANDVHSVTLPAMTDPDAAETVFKQLWSEANPVLRALKSEGNLVYLVTSDVYNNYEDSLNAPLLEIAYLAKQNGREGLRYNGIPVVDVGIMPYLEQYPTIPQSFAILTDRRNLAMAVNTNAYPGTEIRFWYNPDEMENRQRAIFMAGTDYLLPELIMTAFPAP